MVNCSYLVKENFASIVIDNIPYTIDSSHFNFNKVIEALKAGEFDDIKRLIDETEVYEDFLDSEINDEIVIERDRIYYQGNEINNALTRQIIQMIRQGFKVDPLIKFLKNLQLNPSYRAVNELYDFMECADMISITEDGCFLAYKKVRHDYKDIYSGTFDNSIGAVCEMERNMVNEDKNTTCSYGLHFCSRSYLSHYGSSVDCRVMIVKINPRDVVAIPADYNNAKGRTCRYEVVGEVDDWKTEQLTSAVDQTFDSANKYSFSEADDESIEYQEDSDLFDDYDIDDDDDDYDEYYNEYVDDDEDDDDDEELFEDEELTTEEKLEFLNDYTNAQLTDMYNRYSGNPRILKFRDKSTAVRRVLPYFDVLDEANVF